MTENPSAEAKACADEIGYSWPGIEHERIARILDRFAERVCEKRVSAAVQKERERIFPPAIPRNPFVVDDEDSARDERPAPETSFAADLAAAQEPLGEEFEKVLHDNLDQLYVSSASPAVVDYSERAREIVRKSTFVYGSSIDGEPNHSWIDATTAQKEIAAALSAVASERQTAAIRAFGERVWSDTEEVAYQAGATDEHADLLTQCQEQRHRAQDAEAETMALLARLQEPDEELVEAVTRVICPQRWENLNAGEQEREKSYARAVLTKIAEILK
jgi:hypothetical protein